MHDIAALVETVIRSRGTADPRRSVLVAISGIDGRGKGYVRGRAAAYLERRRRDSRRGDLPAPAGAPARVRPVLLDRLQLRDGARPRRGAGAGTDQPRDAATLTIDHD